jgi:hypothetical protein
MVAGKLSRFEAYGLENLGERPGTAIPILL